MAFCEALRKPDGKLNGAEANGSSEFSSFSSWDSCGGRGGGASDGGPFNDMDDDDVWECCDIGEDRSWDGKTLPVFRIGEFSLPFGAENLQNNNSDLSFMQTEFRVYEYLAII